MKSCGGRRRVGRLEEIKLLAEANDGPEELSRTFFSGNWDNGCYRFAMRFRFEETYYLMAAIGRIFHGSFLGSESHKSAGKTRLENQSQCYKIHFPSNLRHSFHLDLASQRSNRMMGVERKRMPQTPCPCTL